MTKHIDNLTYHIDSLNEIAKKMFTDTFNRKSDETIATNELALIGIDAKFGRLEGLAERTAQAAERQADALETFVALVASCIGVSTARCSDNALEDQPVNYLRSGNGSAFPCDKDVSLDDGH